MREKGFVTYGDDKILQFLCYPTITCDFHNKESLLYLTTQRSEKKKKKKKLQEGKIIATFPFSISFALRYALIFLYISLFFALLHSSKNSSNIQYEFCERHSIQQQYGNIIIQFVVFLLFLDTQKVN